MTRLTFLDAPLSRHTDPSTSHEAAEAVRPKLGELEGMFVEVLTDLGEATAAEVGEVAHQRYGANRESVRKRASALVEPKRQIVIAGERACRTTGKRAATYRVK